MIALKNLPDGDYHVGPVVGMIMTVRNGRAWLCLDRILYGQFNMTHLLRINVEVKDESMEMLAAMSEPAVEAKP